MNQSSHQYTTTNTRILLAKRPTGWPDESCFQIEACAEPECGRVTVAFGNHMN